MSKAVTAVSKIVTIIESLDEDERQRVFDAVVALTGLSFGIPPSAHVASTAAEQQKNEQSDSSQISAKDYFDLKSPINKIEELAVAARFLEETAGVEEVSKEDLSGVFKAARRNFDRNNFNRDMGNAKTRGLFNKGGSAGQNSLSHAGQGYIDALPERDGARLKKRSAPKRAKKAAKKSTKR